MIESISQQPELGALLDSGPWTSYQKAILALTASAVEFPLPRGPIKQVRPRGMLPLKPGRNPPLISIFSTSHIRLARGSPLNHM
jgi:hypothetical protein